MKTSIADTEFVLTLSCPNRIGIVYAVARFLFERGCNITDSAQFDDVDTDRFFMRVAFATTKGPIARDAIATAFATMAADFAMTWELHDTAVRPRVLAMVSKFDHCLHDLLYRHSTGELDMAIPLIISNHKDAAGLAATHGIPFEHLPITADNKSQQERRLLQVIKDERIDLVVLARYMQVLSPDLCAKLPCPAINIHHSFLPSFRGATPYRQAHKRGVKLIGATAHYVTAGLDEGPIIEQGVERVNHTLSPEDLVTVGRDVEKTVLARAVKLHIDRRILINNGKTVVFN